MDRICPLLGLDGDRRSAIDGADSSHRCYANAAPIAIDRHQQAQLCLAPAHDRCPRFLAHVARRGALPGRSSVAGGLVSTRLVLAPEPVWRGIAGRARGGRAAPMLAISGALVAGGVGAVALAAAVLEGGGLEPRLGAAGERTPSPRPAAAVATGSPEPSSTPSPSPVPTPSPTASPAPSAPLISSPTAEPPPPPPPTVAPAPPQQTYVVEQGDTLALIAQQFGTTVEALQAANGIEDPNTINVGQVLVIP